MTQINLCRLEDRIVTSIRTLRADELMPTARTYGGLWRLVEDAAWWLCRRLGMTFHLPIERVEYNSVRIDADSLIHKAKLNQRDLRHLWNQNGKYLIVGRDTARDLWGEMADKDFMQFSVNERFGLDGEMKVIGLQVVIVPWIEEGLFVLPELKVMQAA